MRFTGFGGTRYVVLGPVFNKTLEVGGGRATGQSMRHDFSVSLSTTGDHAGLRIYARFGGVMFELNLTDTRHWDWVNDRFYLPGEEPVFEGYPHE